MATKIKVIECGEIDDLMCDTPEDKLQKVADFFVPYYNVDDDDGSNAQLAHFYGVLYGLKMIPAYEKALDKAIAKSPTKAAGLKDFGLYPGTKQNEEGEFDRYYFIGRLDEILAKVKKVK